MTKIATHAVARSRARDIGDSANDRLGNFDSVFNHHSRTLVSFSFRQHGVTIRRVRLGVWSLGVERLGSWFRFDFGSAFSSSPFSIDGSPSGEEKGASIMIEILYNCLYEVFYVLMVTLCVVLCFEMTEISRLLINHTHFE